jgi:hypothetical protein
MCSADRSAYEHASDGVRLSRHELRLFTGNQPFREDPRALNGPSDNEHCRRNVFPGEGVHGNFDFSDIGGVENAVELASAGRCQSRQDSWSM